MVSIMHLGNMEHAPMRALKAQIQGRFSWHPAGTNDGSKSSI